MKIKTAEKSDISSLDRMQRKYFDSSTCENFDFLLSNDAYRVFIAIDDKKIVGFVTASVTQDTSDLLQICVDESMRKRGVATSLLNHLFDQLKIQGVISLFLEVNEHNHAAVNLYNKLGFILINKRKNYYGDQTALIMQKLMN